MIKNLESCVIILSVIFKFICLFDFNDIIFGDWFIRDCMRKVRKMINFKLNISKVKSLEIVRRN